MVLCYTLGRSIKTTFTDVFSRQRNPVKRYIAQIWQCGSDSGWCYASGKECLRYETLAGLKYCHLLSFWVYLKTLGPWTVHRPPYSQLQSGTRPVNEDNDCPELSNTVIIISIVIISPWIQVNKNCILNYVPIFVKVDYCVDDPNDTNGNCRFMIRFFQSLIQNH